MFLLFFNRAKYKLFEIIPISFVISISFISLITTALYYMHSSVTALLYLLPLFIIILAAANLFQWRRKGVTYSDNPDIKYKIDAGYQNQNHLSNKTIYVLMVIGGLLMLYGGVLFTYHADSMVHTSTIREIVENRQIFPTNTFFMGKEGLGADPRTGLYHVALALISIITKIEPYHIWIWLPAFLLPIMLCAYFSFAREIFRNDKIAILSVILFLLCFEGVNRVLLRRIGYPFSVALQIQFVALLLIFKYLRNKKLKFLLFSAFLGFGIAAVHIYAFFQFFLALFAFFTFACFFRRDNKNIIKTITKLGLITIIFSIPFLVVKYKLSYSIDNPFDEQLRHLLFLSNNIYIVNPITSLMRIGPLGIFAFIMTPFLYKQAKKDDGILFLFSNMVLTPLIIFNPVAVSLLGKFITTGLVRRIVRLAPYIAVMGFFSYRMIDSLFFQREWKQKVKAFLFLAILALTLYPYISQYYFCYKPSAIKKERKQTVFKWIKALEFLENKIEKPSVILSDLGTSYSIPAFTKHFVTAIPIGHSSPKDVLNIERAKDVTKSLNPYINMKNTLSILKKYDVEYILLNETYDHPIYRAFGSINPILFDEMRRKFERYPNIFNKISEEEDWHIYKYSYRSDIPESLLEKSLNRPFILTDKPKLDRVVNAVFDDQFMLLGASTDKDTVGFNDVLTIKCYWENLKEESTRKYYKVSARFDTDYNKNFLYNKYWSKIYRKSLEQIKGKRYRFRFDHNPTNSIHPPEHWKRGEIVIDKFDVRIPSDISPGIYNVKIKLRAEAFGVNYRISDFLQNHDTYDGAKVGSIVIQK
ncbi:MAG TPA: DUF6541 family protein [Candidatus Krumholzibacteriaceae bacterium]|nr:DUF6541 family protein [Candidatus Krumholzibacteriaceae bacterium]